MPDPAPVTNPLGPPTVTGTTLTVDTALQQPTRITRMISDLTLQRFFVDRLFASNGGVTGGAVVYDEATANELYTDRDVERVAPGSEFPIVGSTRPTPKVAPVEKYGGKFYVTDEAKDRNDVAYFTRQVRMLANTIVRKINTIGVQVIEAAIAAQGGALEMVGHDWGAVVVGGSNQTNQSSFPHADFANAQLTADQKELGIVFDTLLVNPAEKAQLSIIYGDKLTQVLRDNGIEEMFATNRIAAGSAYMAAAKQVGQLRIEQPLATETTREGAPAMRQRTWVQSSVRPVMFVDNPFALLKITGL